jgi:hypothetical protein
MKVLVIVSLVVLASNAGSIGHSFVDQGVCKLCEHLIDKIVIDLQPRVDPDQVQGLLQMLNVCF